MESNNPALRKSTFAFAAEDSATMTMSGAINKSGILFVILMVGAAIGQIVARNAGDDDMPQAHLAHSLGHA